MKIKLLDTLECEACGLYYEKVRRLMIGSYRIQCCDDCLLKLRDMLNNLDLKRDAE